MVLGKRTREYSSDSNSGCFETLLTDKPMSSSPLKRMHEDDVSGLEAMLRRRKQPKKTPATLVSSSSNNKMAWTKDDELIILGSIVDYENETKLRYRSDWDAFYEYVKDFIEADFSKKQLSYKIRNLNKRFLGNKERSNDGKELSFTNTEDDEIFKLSVIIWDTNETECASDEMGQAKDVPCLDHERADENMDQAKDVSYEEHEPVNENIDQANVDVLCEEHEGVNDEEEAVPLPCSEDELVSNVGMKTTDKEEKERTEEDVVDEFCAMSDKEEKEKSEEDGGDEFCALKDALTDKEEKESNEEDGVDEFCALKDALTDKEEKENNEEDFVDEFCALKDALTDKEEKERNEEAVVDEFCAIKDALTDKEEKEKSEEDGVNKFCALKDALTDKEEKESNEEDVMDEFCALKDALTTLFQSIGKHQQKLLLKNLKTLGAQRRKELADEWKALLDEEMKINAKKLTLSAKIASAGDSF